MEQLVSATRKVGNGRGVYSIDGLVTGDHYMIVNRSRTGWSIHIDDVGTVSHASTLTVAAQWVRDRELNIRAARP